MRLCWCYWPLLVRAMPDLYRFRVSISSKWARRSTGGLGERGLVCFIQEPVDVFFYAAGGEFWKMDFLEDYELLEQQKVPLSGRTNLDDHAIRQCPDGSYLHAASGKIEETNDSGYMMMYDASWARINNHVLGEKSSEIAYNDMPLICHEKGRFVSFIDYNAVSYTHLTLPTKA